MKRLKKGADIQVDIEKSAFSGKGLGKIDGMAVFVDRTFPGDRVTARVVKSKKNYAEARLLSVDSPSPDRIDPPCRYAFICGGCKWQALNYEAQIRYKADFVRESIEHIGLIKDVPVRDTIPSKKLFGYRNKMEFSCSDRRWLLPEEMDQPDADRGFALGLHVSGAFYKILDIEACLLAPELGARILNDIRSYMKASGAEGYNQRAHTGLWRFVMLRHSYAEDQWMANIITSEKALDQVEPLADLLTEKYPRITSVVNNITSRKACVAAGEYEIRLAGRPTLKDRIGGLEFEISANSFFQTNTSGAETLYAIVKQFAGLTGRETVLDLYSGAGTIAMYLADSAVSVTGLEIVESATADAERNRILNGIDNCKFITGDIKESLPDLPRPDVVIVDPPRAGMHPDVVKTLLDMKPDRIVYVSCNPSTLARDLGLMKSDYVPVEAQPVDLFPHTWHIESAVKLERLKYNFPGITRRIPSPGLPEA